MTLTKKVYTGTTDATGRFTFVVTTPNQNVTGFAKSADIYVADFATTADTLLFGGGVRPGKPGVYSASLISVGGVYSTVN
ncbi:hypothetical protein, partial [Salmonella enterica]|uniref:hypothetical protein n=1 Tax=Salmonella enterica TaxID=28901 RepID=UPI0020A39378